MINKLQLFEGTTIRTIWDSQTEEWYFSFAVHPTTNHHQQDTNRQLPKPLLSTEDGIHS